MEQRMQSGSSYHIQGMCDLEPEMAAKDRSWCACLVQTPKSRAAGTTLLQHCSAAS
jgi:hypothetical protein